MLAYWPVAAGIFKKNQGNLEKKKIFKFKNIKKINKIEEQNWLQIKVKSLGQGWVLRNLLHLLTCQTSLYFSSCLILVYNYHTTKFWLIVFCIFSSFLHFLWCGKWLAEYNGLWLTWSKVACDSQSKVACDSKSSGLWLCESQSKVACGSE